MNWIFRGGHSRKVDISGRTAVKSLYLQNVNFPGAGENQPRFQLVLNALLGPHQWFCVFRVISEYKRINLTFLLIFFQRTVSTLGEATSTALIFVFLYNAGLIKKLIFPKLGASVGQYDDRYLPVGSDNELDPLLSGLRWADFSVWDVGGDEAEQAVLEDLGTVIHVVLLRGQFCQVLLLTDRRQAARKKENTKSVTVAVFHWRAEECAHILYWTQAADSRHFESIFSFYWRFSWTPKQAFVDLESASSFFIHFGRSCVKTLQTAVLQPRPFPRLHQLQL